MTGHLTLLCEVYIFIFDNAWTCSVSVVVKCKIGMLVVAVSHSMPNHPKNGNFLTYGDQIA